MKTAEEIILEFKELPPEEWKKVVDDVDSTRENTFQITQYSDKDLTLLDQRYQEAKNGINVDRFSSMEEAIQFLGLTEEGNQ